MEKNILMKKQKLQETAPSNTNTLKIKFKKLHPDAVIPKQASELAGGWDVVCTEIKKVSDSFVICKLGMALQPPKGYKITIVPRSSFTSTAWILQNSPALGDADFLGEYELRFRAIPLNMRYSMGLLSTPMKFEYQEFPYQVGDRVAQMYLEEVIPVEFEEAEELSSTERGEGGFGHTGN